jgi:outer membrane lipoprotein-sorting protein
MRKTSLTITITITTLTLLSFLVSIACAQQGQLVNPVAPAGGAPAGAAAAAAPGALTLDDVLDMLEKRGQTLDSFVANVKMTEADSKGFEETRLGKVWYQRLEGGKARIRVSFTERQDGKRKGSEPKDYVLDPNGRLTERDHTKKIEIKRQVIKPGEKMDLFRLGDGPFPLPIGQKKEDVKKQFEANIEKPTKDDPPGTIHLVLKPRTGTPLKKQFSAIDVFVDPKTQMPARIDTADAKGDQGRTTVLEEMRVNEKLVDTDFELKEITDPTWNIREEPFKD